MSWSEPHLLDVERLSADEVEAILALAADMREMLDGGEQVPDRLRGQHLALLFAEPSTRTRLSFELAARRLGAQTYVFDRGSSSMVKGETFTDTVRNLDAIGFTMLVVRHHRTGAAWVATRHFGGHVVNAGDGWHAHPTQALLDLFTLRRAWGGGRDALRGRKIAIVGDILHSRVARSNVWTLTQAGADVWLCGPRAWLRGFDELSRTLPSERRLSVTDSLESAVSNADAVMGLRVQKERMSGGLSAAEYVDRYQIDAARFALAKPGAVYLHPGPINEGVEVTRAVCLGPRSLVLEQVRNGVPVRMAVLALVASVAGGQAIAATRDLSSVNR
ncbi:MAG TPA: aspartate carbamoyltransferase catalytic subunit [Candidatus Limnocylindrales bacterium]